MTEESTPTRRPYTGSCHCGAIKYIVYLTMPHTPPDPNRDRTKETHPPQVIYRCNCTTCQKAGIMHVRLDAPPEDFLLLSPLDPLKELGDYTCFEKRLHFLFCKTCGVRCFSCCGEGELVERELETTGEKATGWSPGKGWREGEGDYLSVNAYTIDAGQEGLDLREWTEKKWVMYLDCLEMGGISRDRTYERPQPGGAY